MLAIFEYKCLDKLVLGKEIWSEFNADAHKYNAKNKEAVMLIKLSIMDEMIPEVQSRDDAFTILYNW